MYEMRSAQRGTVASFGTGSGSAGGSVGESRASLHAKAVVVDNRLLVVGSMNLDLRSQLQNKMLLGQILKLIRIIRIILSF